MAGAGYGSKDADGSWGFRATSDGKVILGNTSDDVLQITGTVEQEGSSYQISGDDARIKINGDTNSHPGLEFYENGTRKWIIFNNYGDDSLDFKAGSEANPAMVINANGAVGIGTDSPDYKLDVAGNISIDEHIRHNGDVDTRISFPQTGKINLVADGKSVFKFTGTEIVLNNANENYDTKVMADNGQVVLHVDASHNRVGINTTSPTVDLDVDGTTKSNDYVTAVGTQDLGSGTSSTLSISAGVMILDADSITGTDAGGGMFVHDMALPNGTTNGQRLTIIVNTTFGSSDNIMIMPNPSNIGGAFGALVPNSKTSVEFIWYGTHWFPVQ